MFSTQMVESIQNELTEEIVEVGVITSKRHLDRDMDRKSLDGYGPMQAGGTNVNKANCLAWASWTEGPVFKMYE